MKSQDLKAGALPDKPGVYFFVGSDGKPFYIGKAASIRDRVKSYFSSDLNDRRGELIVRMVEESKSLNWQETDSVLEALLLEAELIKKHKPRYNSLGKDDKSFNYVVLTRENFSRVFLVRGKDLAEIEQGRMVRRLTKRDIKIAFGPFTSGAILKEALKLVRKIFPFRDSCIPCVEKNKKEDCKPCFNAQLHLCPGVCSGDIDTKDYRRNIEHLRLFFEGKKKQLVKELQRDMKVFARQQEFEKAGETKRQLEALSYIQDMALMKKPPLRRPTSKWVGSRIEAYDVAHLGGKDAVGVMIVVEDGEPVKNEYRKFILNKNPNGSDTAGLREVLERRFTHSEWPFPQIIAVDGGMAQINITKKTLEEYFGDDIINKVRVVGVVKDEHHRPKKILSDKHISQEKEGEILLANNEAHRFSIQFHRKKRAQKMKAR